MLAEQVLDRIDTVILLLDSSMRIVKCNQALKNLSDKVCEDIYGKPVAKLPPVPAVIVEEDVEACGVEGVDERAEAAGMLGVAVGD